MPSHFCEEVHDLIRERFVLSYSLIGLISIVTFITMVKSSLKGSKEFSLIIFVLFLLIGRAASELCIGYRQVYGENGFIDRLISCASSKSSDIDLTSNGEQFKLTAKSLVEQGFADRTSITYVRLSGLWTARRPRFVNTGWTCEPNKTLATSIIELSGLALSMIERLDIPANHSETSTASSHRPCETFNLPLSFCRQSRPIYRVVKTWADKAYFNLTLSQAHQFAKKPNIDMIAPIFTCPEAFRQRISFSPSAIYILPSANHHLNGNSREKRQQQDTMTTGSDAPLINPVTHPISFASTHGDKGLIMSSYPSLTKSIMNKAVQVMRSSLEECIDMTDSDLSPMSDHTSYRSDKYLLEATEHLETIPSSACSDKSRLAKMIDVANQALETKTPGVDKRDSTQHTSHARRSQTLLEYPKDMDQLLDPFSYYYFTDSDIETDQMIDDNTLREHGLRT